MNRKKMLLIGLYLCGMGILVYACVSTVAVLDSCMAGSDLREAVVNCHAALLPLFGLTLAVVALESAIFLKASTGYFVKQD